MRKPDPILALPLLSILAFVIALHLLMPNASAAPSCTGSGGTACYPASGVVSCTSQCPGDCSPQPYTCSAAYDCGATQRCCLCGAPTTTTVTCSPNPQLPGIPTLCTATVSGSSTGAVQFTVAGSGFFVGPPSCILSGGSCSVPYTQATAGLATITGTYFGDATHAGSYGTYTVTYGLTGCGDVCATSAVCTYSSLTPCGSSTYSITPGTGGSLSCHICETFQTPFTPVTGSLAASSAAASPASVAPTKSVNNYNIKNVPWFLTCPLDPSIAQNANPADNRLFYTFTGSGANPNVAGDVCLANPSPLSTTMDLPTSITWSYSQFATATVGSIKVNGFGSLQLQNYAYSPQLDTGPGGNFVSSSFSVNSYVFERVPAVAENGIWTWSATFADFGRSMPDSQQASGTGFKYRITCVIGQPCP